MCVYVARTGVVPTVPVAAVGWLTWRGTLAGVPLLSSLIERIDEALKRDDVKAGVITGEKDNFSGGYDMNALDELQEGKAGPELIRTLTNILETARKPFVAAINGPALGAGFEVAMACNARIATPTAKLRLPELKLGLIPGGGGTQRLPRLVGLRNAIEILLTSKPVHGEEAHKLGLVDAIVPADKLLENARQMALDIWARRKPWVSSLYKTDKLEPLGKAREILNEARGQAPSLQHSQVCLDVIEEGIVSGPDAGLSKERKAFQILLKSDTCKEGARKRRDQARSRL
ncbi:hypothetical protein M8C21_016903 [Ambrosia artemisiifolia]|uniref:Uncharacterized protein n=1 Tax=Ambrosia artemisiifolia TaxID=4212 RepID=A0AAD5CMG7_AMBAR|nr:hypothetical protein M8C21_016903 [Ambrosia artemisiifolia]